MNPDWVELLMGWPRQWTDTTQPAAPDCADRRETYWGEGWEADTPRTSSGISNRMVRLRCIGNGQVPAVAALAWHTLTERLSASD